MDLHHNKRITGAFYAEYLALNTINKQTNKTQITLHLAYLKLQSWRKTSTKNSNTTMDL